MSDLNNAYLRYLYSDLTDINALSVVHRHTHNSHRLLGNIYIESVCRQRGIVLFEPFSGFFDLSSVLFLKPQVPHCITSNETEKYLFCHSCPGKSASFLPCIKMSSKTIQTITR